MNDDKIAQEVLKGRKINCDGDLEELLLDAIDLARHEERWIILQTIRKVLGERLEETIDRLSDEMADTIYEQEIEDGGRRYEE